MSVMLFAAGVLASVMLSLLIARLALTGILLTLTMMPPPEKRNVANAPNQA